MTSKRFKFFTSSNKKIRYLLLNQKKDLLIIFFHGFMSDIEGEKPSTLYEYCKKKKIGFLTFECSGHGKSSGKFTKGNISQWTNDAKVIIKSKTRGKKKLIFIGSSMGSWIALNLFKEFKNKIIGFIGIGTAPEFLDRLMWNNFSKKIKKIINKKKIYYLESDSKKTKKKTSNRYTYPLTKQLFLDGRKNKVLNLKFYLKIPVKMLHGSKDEVVPTHFSKKVLKIFPRANKKLLIVNGGDHSLSRKKDLKKICKELNQIVSNHI